MNWKIFGRIILLGFVLIASAVNALAWYSNDYWPGQYGDYRYTSIVYQPYLPYLYGGFNHFTPVYYHYSYRYYSSEPYDHFYRPHYYDRYHGYYWD